MALLGNNEKVDKIFDLIPCPQGCKLLIHFEDLLGHLQKDCPHRCVFCSFCKKPILFTNVQKHFEECDSIPVPCLFTSAEEEPYSQSHINSKTKHDSNHSKEDNKQTSLNDFMNAPTNMIGEALENQPDNSAYNLDSILQLNQHQKLALEMQVVELKASADSWKNKCNILKKELCIAQSQLSQKTNNFPGTDTSEVNSTADKNHLNAISDQLLDKVIIISKLIKIIGKDVTSTKENVQKRQHQEAVEMKRFRQYVLRSMETSNKSMALSLKNQKEELREHAAYLRSLECRNTHVGVLVWKVKKFSRLQNEAKNAHNHKITSVPFYTNEYGYKLCMELYPNGEANGEFIALSLCIMRGGYDAILKWPVTYKATFILLDQLEGKESFEATIYSIPEPQYVGRPTTDKNSALIFYQYFPLAKLHPQYVVNDQLFIKAVVTFTSE